MSQSLLIQSCFTMQMFFYQMFQNVLIITCSTNFQGAVEYVPKCDQTFLRRSLCACNLLPLLSQLPRPPPLWALLGASSPRWGVQCGKGAKRVTTPRPTGQQTAAAPTCWAVETRLGYKKGWKQPLENTCSPAPLSGYLRPAPGCPAKSALNWLKLSLMDIQSISNCQLHQTPCLLNMHCSLKGEKCLRYAGGDQLFKSLFGDKWQAVWKLPSHLANYKPICLGRGRRTWGSFYLLSHWGIQ